jgi:hypothetical protein
MSNEGWLHALRGEPSTAFRDELRARLRAHEEELSAPRHEPRRVLLAAAAMVAVALLVSVPGVRASVSQFLSLFRVVHVVAVPVDPGRLARLKAENLEIGTLIGEHVEVLRDPGPPVRVPSPADAAAAAQMTLALPQYLPRGTQVMEAAVVGERALRIRASGQRLEQVMAALGIDDLSVPPGLDGQIVDVRVPPVVMVRYDHGRSRTRLFQARSPELRLPEGIDVRSLGEIGLRIVGLAPAQAREFAQAIDWHSTLVVPMPPNATSFRQVRIGGRPGVLIQHEPRDQSPTCTIIWSTPERVFVLVSILHVDQAVAVADSVAVR